MGGMTENAIHNETMINTPDQKIRQRKAHSSPDGRKKSKKHVTIKSDPDRKKKSRKHKKQKLLRPNSPAAYPSPLPILDGSFNESIEEEDDSELRCDKSTTKEVVMDSIEEKGKCEVNKDEKQSIEPFCSDFKDSYDGDNVNTASWGFDHHCERESFLAFRIHYLIIHIAIMLADGLQGTHLYVLYEGYGYTVASLYCLGFVSGAITSPFIGPLVDKVGRRNSAIAYCVLEIAINILEQYDLLAGLIVSRIVGGVTTNLLFTVFESWLVTEHRRRGFSEEKLETVLRDSVVASNLSAIASGCIAHILASKFGAKGPFEGAVACTFVALILVLTRWEENYGSTVPGVKSINNYMSKAFTTIVSDSKIYRIGIIQGLTEGALQTFVFLWSPALRHFAIKLRSTSTGSVIGLDADKEPAYGLIFGAFMACGALGGMSEPMLRKLFVSFIYGNTQTDVSELIASENQQQHEKVDGVYICSSLTQNVSCDANTGEDGCVSDTSDVTFEDDSSLLSGKSLLIGKLCKTSEVQEESFSDLDSESEAEDEKPVAVELLASICFFSCAGLLATPVFVDENSPHAFSASLAAFLVYECVVGIYMPCEAVLRTVYMPNDSICSLMTMLRVIVNVAVALGVISTNYIQFTTAFAACSGALIVAGILQLSLVQPVEWKLLWQAILGRLPFCVESTVSADIIQINSPLKFGDLDISNSSPVPDAKRLSSSQTSPDQSMSSFSDSLAERNDQRMLDSCEEPNYTGHSSPSHGLRRRGKCLSEEQ